MPPLGEDGRGSPVISIINGIPRHPLWRMAEPVNLEIKRGEQIAIVGDNAAGKSRLVEILTGHYPLLLNEVHYDFSPSESPLVSDNLKYISFRDAYGPQDSTYYYQRRWNLGDQSDEDSPLIVLSSGELRKYQINKALASNPRVLILDNPFIGLDAQTRIDFRNLLERLTKEANLLVILVLSKRDDIPNFITHVLPVEGLHLLPKMTLEEYRNYYATVPKPSLASPLPSEKTPLSLGRGVGGEAIIRFRNVSIKYGGRTILQPLDWTVHEGERWALSGPNGSGKSTLLSLVCADNPQAYAQDIELFGHRRGTGESIWEIKRHIGYVSPEMHRAYQKNIPAIDVVASGLKDPSKPSLKGQGFNSSPFKGELERVFDWMKVFGIEGLADRSFLQLSSGEQRLCLLARAFVKDPELLILDEPLHGLDDRNRELVRQIVERFCERPHKTLVFVTHYEEDLPCCITHRLNLSLSR